MYYFFGYTENEKCGFDSKLGAAPTTFTKER